eukprot:349864-Chlamydomonas_euryale.AAC.1
MGTIGCMQRGCMTCAGCMGIADRTACCMCWVWGTCCTAAQGDTCGAVTLTPAVCTPLPAPPLHILPCGPTVGWVPKDCDAYSGCCAAFVSPVYEAGMPTFGAPAADRWMEPLEPT